MRMISIPFTQVRKDEICSAPRLQHTDDAGFDLVVSRYMQVFPDQIAHLSTNIALAIPNMLFGMIVPRSSALSVKGLHVSIGIIDPGYRGEIMVVVKNMTGRSVHINPGDRVAQLLVLPLQVVTFDLKDELASGSRGDAGFGSTGGYGSEGVDS